MKPFVLAFLLAPLIARAGVDQDFDQARNADQQASSQRQSNAASAAASLDEKQFGSVTSQVLKILGTTAVETGQLTHGSDLGFSDDTSIHVKLKTAGGLLCQIEATEVDVSREMYRGMMVPARLPALRSLCGEIDSVKDVEQDVRGSASGKMLDLAYEVAADDCNAAVWSVDVQCYGASGKKVNDARVSSLEAIRSPRGVLVYQLR